MGKIKSFFANTSIKISFVSYIIICLLLAILLSLTSSFICQLGQNKIYQKYQKVYEDKYGREGYIISNNPNEHAGIITYYTENITTFYSPTEKIIDKALDILSVVLTPIWFVLCITITSMLFYKKVLQEPLKLLGSAADNISKNNLDFTIKYDRQNEMGKLCTSFEDMRFALQKNNSEMWRHMDERKRLNAAFSHDLRTPLTVLKGYNEMLCKYVPEGKITEQKVVQTANIMSEHIARLENYVNAMSSLQKLSDIEIQISALDTTIFIQKLVDTAMIVCDKFNVLSINNCSCNKLYLDEHTVLQVYDNLLSNAIRYAKSNINISFDLKDDYFIITISDDGYGFDSKSLDKATEPFFKEKGNVYDNHFGMGLNICKLLCEKHGGAIILSNNVGGGACVIVSFNMK